MNHNAPNDNHDHMNDHNDVATILLTLPQDLFRRVMDSAFAHNREVMAEFTYRLTTSFDVIPDRPLQ